MTVGFSTYLGTELRLTWDKAAWGMSHLILSLMNRHNQTESAVCKLWLLYFQRISFRVICEYRTSLFIGWHLYYVVGSILGKSNADVDKRIKLFIREFYSRTFRFKRMRYRKSKSATVYLRFTLWYTLFCHESGSFRSLSHSPPPPGSFAHCPFRPESFRSRVVSPTFPFSPESFRFFFPFAPFIKVCFKWY